MPLQAYATTVVGAYSVPRWYEMLEKQVEAGTLSWEEMRDAQWRASQGALADQEAAGIDVYNGGEMHRRQNNRHAPPNAMLNYFWTKLPGYEKDPSAEYGLVTRPMQITPKDENVTHPSAVVTGPIRYGDLGLLEEFEFVAKYARDPDSVKVTMTGPHMLAKASHDEYYGGDLNRMMQDLASVINQNFKQLVEAGCKHVQIDEPLFMVGGSTREEVEQAIDAVNQAFEGVGAYKWQHICQGNYAVGAHYDGQIGHRYFDVEDYKSDLVAQIQCDAVMVEWDYVEKYQGYLRNQQLAVGAANVQDMNVEKPEQIAETVRERGSFLSPEQTLITSSCGMNHLPRHIAEGKLAAMAGARDILRRG